MISCIGVDVISCGTNVGIVNNLGSEQRGKGDFWTLR